MTTVQMFNSDVKLKLEEYQEPKAVKASKLEIIKFAEKSAKALKFDRMENLKPFIEKLGGRVEWDYTDFSDPDFEIRPAEIVNGKGEFVIYSDIYCGHLRTRLNLAHDLGHYILHSDSGKRPMIFKRKEHDLIEWQAHWFAVGFLMPEDQVLEMVKKYGWLPEIVSGLFMVSNKAMEYRINDLKKTLGIK